MKELQNLSSFSTWTASWVSMILLIFSTWPSDVLGGPHERRLLNDLLEHYNTLERPVYNESEPLQLLFGLTLQQIIDVVSMTWANFKKIFTFKHFRVGLRKLGTE